MLKNLEYITGDEEKNRALKINTFLKQDIPRTLDSKLFIDNLALDHYSWSVTENLLRMLTVVILLSLFDGWRLFYWYWIVSLVVIQIFSAIVIFKLKKNKRAKVPCLTLFSGEIKSLKYMNSGWSWKPDNCFKMVVEFRDHYHNIVTKRVYVPTYMGDRFKTIMTSDENPKIDILYYKNYVYIPLAYIVKAIKD